MGRITFKDTRNGFLAKLDSKGLQAVQDAADVLLEEANRTVPLDKSPLQNSGDTVAEVTATGWQSAVFYNTPYAVKQHEDVTLRHKPGRRARWLELTAQERQADIEQKIADRLKEVK